MADPNSIQGKDAIVAGGAKNLGGLISRDQAGRGAEAVIVHDNSAGTRAAADATVAEAAGAKALAIQGDLTRVAECERLFDEAIRAFGRLDIAINTTGVVIKKPILAVTEEDYDGIFAVNSKAAFFFICEAGRPREDLHDRELAPGRLHRLVCDLPGSKAPIEHFTRAASKEFGARGISVTAVGPGPMETPFSYGQETGESAAYNQSAAALSEFTRTGLTDPSDIAPLVRFLVSEGRWVTGQTIFANGGYTTR